MKSKEIIQELIKQYEFDYKMTEEFCEEKEKELIRLDSKINILKWVLSE